MQLGETGCGKPKMRDATEMENLPDKAFHRMPDVASVAIPSSTSSERRRAIPRKIANLIGKVGLRYEPSVKSDLDAHAARVALLAEDVAAADPWTLEQAIDRWVATKPYLPKASDLNAMMAEIDRPKGDGKYVNLAERYNARLIAEGSHLRWRYRDPTNLESDLYLSSTLPLENKLAEHP